MMEHEQYKNNNIDEFIQGANVGTNLLSHSFCGDFGYKVPLVYRNCPSQARGNSDKPRELYSRSPLRMSDLVDISPNICAVSQSDCVIWGDFIPEVPANAGTSLRRSSLEFIYLFTKLNNKCSLSNFYYCLNQVYKINTNTTTIIKV